MDRFFGIKMQLLGRATSFLTLWALSCCSVVNAGVFFQIGGNEYSNSGAADIPNDTIDVAIEQEGAIANGTVKVTLTFNYAGDVDTTVSSAAKLDILSLNLVNSSSTQNAFSAITLSDPALEIDTDKGINGLEFVGQADTSEQLKADGSKGWDLNIFFRSSPPTFDPGESLSFLLKATGLSPESFLETNTWWDATKKVQGVTTPGPGATGTVSAYASAHLQAINTNGKSGWYANTWDLPDTDPDIDSVGTPEPGSLLVWGMLGVAAVLYRRRNAA